MPEKAAEIAKSVKSIDLLDTVLNAIGSQNTVLTETINSYKSGLWVSKEGFVMFLIEANNNEGSSTVFIQICVTFSTYCLIISWRVTCW